MTSRNSDEESNQDILPLSVHSKSALSGFSSPLLRIGRNTANHLLGMDYMLPHRNTDVPAVINFAQNKPKCMLTAAEQREKTKQCALDRFEEALEQRAKTKQRLIERLEDNIADATHAGRMQIRLFYNGEEKGMLEELEADYVERGFCFTLDNKVDGQLFLSWKEH